MILFEPIPIEEFVSTSMKRKKISSIVDEWRVDLAEVITIVVAHFRDISIFMVSEEQKKTLEDVLVFYLQKSKAVRKLVEKADLVEKQRRESKHDQG